VTKNGFKVQRAGALVVKAAENRPSLVAPKQTATASKPTLNDQQLAKALLKRQKG